LFIFERIGAMASPDRQQRLAALRDTIANIERKPALAEARLRVEQQHDGFPKLAGGLLQEVFTDERRNGGALLGFALGQARSLLGGQRSAIIYLQLADEAQKLGLPYGPGLVSFGLDPGALVLVRPAAMGELLWAAEEALACRAVAAVVADIGSPSKLLDFTASRRLSMRASAMGSSIFLLRYGQGRQASAAHLRWRVMPHRSGRPQYDEKAPGVPRWQVELEKGVMLGAQARLFLEWTQNGFATVPAEPGHTSRSGAAFPLALPAQLADRLSQTA
jgi:protein ImuA